MTLQFLSDCYQILKDRSQTKTLGHNDYFERAILFMLDNGARKDRMFK